jgi:hypothetical protein
VNRMVKPWFFAFCVFAIVVIICLLVSLCGCSTRTNKKSSPFPPLPSLLAAPAPRPAKVTLAWSSSTDSSVVGYIIYSGYSSRTYTNMIDVGNVLICTVSNLAIKTTYFFAATAYNLIGMESDFSNEVRWPAPSRTNLVITIYGGTLQQSALPTGPWTSSPSDMLMLTNPAGTMFSRGTNAVISTKLF